MTLTRRELRLLRDMAHQFRSSDPRLARAIAGNLFHYRSRWAWAAVILLVLGTSGLILGVALNRPGVSVAGSLTFVALLLLPAVWCLSGWFASHYGQKRAARAGRTSGGLAGSLRARWNPASAAPDALIGARDEGWPVGADADSRAPRAAAGRNLGPAHPGAEGATRVTAAPGRLVTSTVRITAPANTAGAELSWCGIGFRKPSHQPTGLYVPCGGAAMRNEAGGLPSVGLGMLPSPPAWPLILVENPHYFDRFVRPAPDAGAGISVHSRLAPAQYNAIVVGQALTSS